MTAIFACVCVMCGCEARFDRHAEIASTTVTVARDVRVKSRVASLLCAMQLVRCSQCVLTT